MSDTTYGLVALGDSDRAVSTADEDIRGYDVKDAAGDDVGTVDDLLIDEAENQGALPRRRLGGLPRAR